MAFGFRDFFGLLGYLILIPFAFVIAAGALVVLPVYMGWLSMTTVQWFVLNLCLAMARATKLDFSGFTHLLSNPFQ